MSKCQRCNSSRIVTVAAHCSDMCSISLNGREVSSGYVPYDMGIGGSDDVEFDLCLDCGQQQGTWPLAESKLERKANGGSATKRAFVEKQNRVLLKHADLASLVINMVELDRRCSADDITLLLIAEGKDDPERVAAGIIVLLDEPQYRAMGETVFGKFDDWEHIYTLVGLVEYDSEDDEDDED